jgi:hypothetical protein
MKPELFSRVVEKFMVMIEGSNLELKIPLEAQVAKNPVRKLALYR